MKKVLLYIIIATFCLSAVLGIGIIVADLWNDLTAKVLFTTVTIFGFSIPALCCSTSYEKSDNRWVSILGIVVCVLTGIYLLLIVWEIMEVDIFGDESTWKTLFSGIILSASLGHINLMLLIKNKDKAVSTIKGVTIGVSIMLDVLLLLLIWIDDFDEIVSWQLYAILAILVVLGTIVSPILNKARSTTVIKEIPNNESLEKLNDLHKDNFVTDEEYELIKERIEKKN